MIVINKPFDLFAEYGTPGLQGKCNFPLIQ